MPKSFIAKLLKGLMPYFKPLLKNVFMRGQSNRGQYEKGFKIQP